MRFSFGKCIYSSEKIKIYDNLLYRWLTFDTRAIQSAINCFNPKKIVLRYIADFIKAVQHQPGDCCLIGLGGGGIAHALSNYSEKISLTTVELSKEIISLAYEFFQIETLSFMKIINEDAASFVKTTNLSFAHILVDLSDNEDHFPLSCANLEFFRNCQNLLTENGILVVNLPNPAEAIKLFYFIKLLFKSTLVIPINKTSNMLVVASKAQNIHDVFDIYKNDSRKIHWTKTWGWVLS